MRFCGVVSATGCGPSSAALALRVGHPPGAGVTGRTGRHIASVRFTGLLREEENAAPAPFDEIWHLAKPVDGNRGWVLAGIEQLQ